MLAEQNASAVVQKKFFYGYSAGMMASGGPACKNTVPPGWKYVDWIGDR